VGGILPPAASLADSRVDTGRAIAGGGSLRLIGLSLFLSGAAGLIYEVVWIRWLSFLTGSGSHALAATLVAFMGGMALGGWLLARAADRPGARPFRIYSLLQVGIVLSAATTIALQSLFIPVLGSLYRSAPPFLLTTARFMGSVLLLWLPTFLMGATLPAAIRGAASRIGVGAGVASLYAINTAGGIVGVLAAGFLLLPSVGYLATFLVGSALSLAAALSGWLIRNPRMEAVTAASRSGSPAPEKGSRSWLLVGFLTGMAMLSAEVLWTRALVTGIFNNSYAIATMLAAVLSGIALGSGIASKISMKREGKAFGLLFLLAVWIPLTGLLLREGLPLSNRLGTPATLGAALALRYAPAFILILPASIASGMLFPLLATLYSPSPEGSASGVGRFSAANTAGAVAGSILATFVGLPLAGLRWSFALTAIAIAGGLLCTGGRRFRTRLAVFAGCSALAVLLTLIGKGVVGALPGYRLLSQEESPGGEVTVLQSRNMPSTLIIEVGGSQASTTTPEGCLKNRLMAYYPLLVHPRPRSVCVICFGTGITAGTACQFPSVERVDCVEINPAVIEVAGLFAAHNHDVLSRGAARIIVEDGRNHLLGTDRLYDVITEEPMHPALAGVVSLYSREYYQIARDRLSPGGIMSQWLPLYAMSDRDCRMVVRTFLDVFPNSTLWLLGRDAMIVGSRDSPVDPMNVVAHLAEPGVSMDLAPFGLDMPWVFLSTYVMGPAELEAYAADARAVTDDMPLLEYSAPSAVYGSSTVSGNIERIMSFRTPPEDASSRFGEDFARAWEAVDLLQRAECARDRFSLADEYSYLQEAFTLCPEFLLAGRRLSESLHQSAAIALERGDPEQAWRMIHMALATGQGGALVLADLASMEVELGMFGQALDHSEAALEMEPGSVAALRAYGMAALGSGEAENARRALILADSLATD
jgi:spermidine synthase